MASEPRETVRLTIRIDERLLALMKEYRVKPSVAVPVFEARIREIIRRASRAGGVDPLNDWGRLLGSASRRRTRRRANFSNR